MSDEIAVSVCCLVYNHENYLRKCLEGIVTQKTTFKFELLIHDDASTDKSADIIREYEEKYPEIIKPIYQKENQHSKRIPINKTYQYPRAVGKYLAWCEGDDYWCDENKLQKQYDIMEKNSSITICTSNVRCILENGELLNRYIPNDAFLEGVYTFEQLCSYFPKTIMQTSSYFVNRSLYMSLRNDYKEVFNSCPVGDIPILYMSLSRGNLYYINEVMSCYRTNSTYSWSNRIKNDAELRQRHALRQKAFYKTFIEYLKAINSSPKIVETIENNYEDYSQKHDLICLVVEKKYKSVFDKKYKKILFKTFSKKEILYFFINAYFPLLSKIIKE